MPLARPRGMFRKSIIVAVLLLGACRQNPEDNAVSGPAPPPAAALAAPNQSLDASLHDLEVELSKALGSNIDKSGQAHILTAEAITDRLLENKLPFTWLTRESYSLEGYVRQIQAAADRIVAEIRNGVDRGTIVNETTELRQQVIMLRHDLAMGGGNPPVPLDSLLKGVVADSTLPTDAGE